MDYEKKYKEALEVIKDNLDALNEITETGANVVNIQSIKNCFYRAFPEIKEPEDNRMRKALIKILNEIVINTNYKELGIDYGIKDIIAWLEKQGGQKIDIPKWKYKKDDMPLLKDSIILNKYGCVAKSPSGAMVSDAWVLDYDELTKLPKEEKVKPKFHEGDWIVDNNNGGVYQVTEIRDDEYCLCHLYAEMMGYFRITDVDNDYRLWTIQDAKDGDVLAAHECYVIFKEIDGLNIKCYCTYHYMGFNPSFHVDTLQNKDAFQPATKEQRDKLIKAMSDAGYTFDFENKELKLLITNGGDFEQENCEQKNCLEREDEVKINRIVSVLENLNVADNDILLKDAEWLESLKCRVHLSKWKPSDEQMKALEHFVRSIGESGHASPYDANLKLVHSLLNDLKKLNKE